MKIENSFTVDAPVEEAWALLTNIPEIAPCLPGAKLSGEEDGVYSGTVKVKVGPVTAEYKGTAEFQERDDAAHRAVINGKGRDTRGAGNAQALISAVMEQVGDQTRVDISTDLKISGKVAQFGRGVMQDVSEKLLGQFAECLATKLSDEPAEATAAATDGEGPVEDAADGATAAAPTAPEAPTAPAAPAADIATPAAAAAPEEDDDALDLLDVAGGAVAKRAVPTVIGAAVIAAIIIWLIRR